MAATGWLLRRASSLAHVQGGCLIRIYQTYPLRTPVAREVILPTVSFIPQRNTSVFRRLSADDLWRGVIGVSNAGRKKGRGKRGNRRKKIDLNKGQQIGNGKENMVWPGLNAPVLRGKEQVQIKKLPFDPEREDKLLKLRDDLNKFRVFKVPPLLRGWTGGKFPGMSVGPPDPIGGYTFDGFDTKVLEFKLVSNMTGNLGRKQRFSAFVVTGNKNGLAGYALGKAPNAKAAIRKAKNKASQKLQYIERFENHTVFHNFFTKEQETAIMVKKKEQGHGLRCHRAINTICEVIGITDLHAKLEGSTKNVQNITKALFAGLTSQETHKQLAERKQLHVVEFRKERDDVPIVMASPEDDTVRSEIGEEEDLEFERLYFGGRMEHVRPKPVPFYKQLRSWRWKRLWYYKRRNQFMSRIQRLALGFEKEGPTQSSSQ